MRIAILLVDEKFIDREVVQAHAFTVEDNTIVSIGSELLVMRNLEYLIIWLTGKQIDVLFTDFIDDETGKILQKTGVRLKTLKDIKDHPLLNRFLVNDI